MACSSIVQLVCFAIRQQVIDARSTVQRIFRHPRAALLYPDFRIRSNEPEEGWSEFESSIWRWERRDGLANLTSPTNSTEKLRR